MPQGRLKNLEGDIVFSDERAETLAEYLEKIQWRVRPSAVLPERPPIWPILDVELDDLQVSEVEQAVKKLKRNKSSGVDDIPPELFKALATTPAGLELIVQLCQICWKTKQIPREWQLSRVAEIFKKGDPAECSNYRPISLLCVGYKIVASILLERLKSAGAESRIWETQYGFKSGSGTADALYMTRRLLDRIWANSDSLAIFLALDWAKAFDSISLTGLVDALIRFGIPQEFAMIVVNIYHGRQFYVKDCGQISNYHSQVFGIF